MVLECLHTLRRSQTESVFRVVHIHVERLPNLQEIANNEELILDSI